MRGGVESRTASPAPVARDREREMAEALAESARDRQKLQKDLNAVMDSMEFRVKLIILLLFILEVCLNLD